MSASVKKLMSIWAGAPIPNHHCSLLSTWLSVLTYKEYHPIRSGFFVRVHCWIQVPITVVDSHSVITITLCITVLYSGVLLTISNAFNLHFQTVISDHNQAIRKMFSAARSLCNLWKLKKKKNFQCFSGGKVDHVNSKITYWVFSILTHTSKGCASPFMHSINVTLCSL